MPLATVVTGAEYSQLATKYGNLLKQLKSDASYMYDALVIVAAFTGVEPTRDLIVPFDNVYRAQYTALTSAGQFLDVVRALNNHVLTRARTNAGATYGSVADWMTDQEITSPGVMTFPQEWADMSKLTGQDVDDFVP